jgi:hypothetical protein
MSGGSRNIIPLVGNTGGALPCVRIMNRPGPRSGQRGVAKMGIVSWPFWLLFRLPGKALMWLDYYFPGKGQVYASARRMGNPVFEVVFSIVFWVSLVLIVSLYGMGIEMDLHIK